MSILVDTNVVLDVLLKRQPFYDNSARVLALVEEGGVRALLGATTVTTIFYLSRRLIGAERARANIASLMQCFEVAPVTRSVLDGALQLPISDFEDAVLHEAARLAGAEAIVTRDVADFASAALPAYTPTQYLLMRRMSLNEKAARYDIQK